MTDRQQPPAEAVATAPSGVEAASGAPAVADRPAARSLGLGGALNARDLGGYRTADGRTVRHGAALRSDALHRLSAEDLEALSVLGLRQVVDLRGLAEVRENGPDRVPGLPVAEIDAAEHSATPMTVVPEDPDGVTLHHLPVYSHHFDIYVALRDALAGRDPASQRALLGDGGGEAIMTGLYRWFVTDEDARGRFARVLRLLAQPGGTPLLFHCTAGKDRTGWTAAVLLTALGVDRDTVFDDYLLTNERHAVLVERIMEAFGTRGVMEEPELLLPVYRAEAAYLEAAFAEVEAGWPDFDGFLADGLGLGDDVLRGLRANLLEG
ncbi:tyrosine-protein phosphatase [Streptacidiphilus sp. ASG 303]|uniref:tyrosine-protein phosphatase n=1 Tax=Streptacidiphilus sp. ASG 303 TaxID=2896847 RepID=UPI001E583CB2|nr:tyrosine-protein phosphatase [Streptacidiphilus sp. ASG 303]MCD0482362.1 tyrosine-protein phosphatase [Streptacidiphilus sp. ASG 303]